MDELIEKSQTVDPEVRAYVYSLVNAVGGSSSTDGRYEVGDDAVHALKDLTRWLRLYDEKTGRYDVKRCIAEANLVKGDLVEILAQWEEKDQESKTKQRLALGCLELLVPLTWPLELDDERTTVNNHRHLPYIQLAQVGYKRVILHHDWAQILRSIVKVGLPSLAVPRRERSRRDEGIIKLLLHFFLNIAVIAQPQHLPSQGDENEISRSATIDSFHNQDIFSLLLTIGSGCGDEFVEQDVVLLETLFHLVKGVDPCKLFMRKDQVSKADNEELKMLLSKEKAMLGGQARNAPSRHNRFGSMIWVRRDDGKVSTVSGQHGIKNERSALQQMDASKKWNRPKYRGKAAQKLQEIDEFGVKVDLTDSARKRLRAFVEDFLDSSFNPLFSSVRKAIAGEAERVQRREMRNHESMFFYLTSWFLTAERARREADRAAAEERQQPPLAENTFAYVAAVLDQETFILLNRCMQRASDELDHQTLQTTLLAFTQILLTVQNMADSRDEEDQEIAENIQNRIFYEESTHDRIIHVSKGADKLGLYYLDAVTECVHVFIRMLENYSKQNVDLQIRSKRRSRRRAKRPQQRQQHDNDDIHEQGEGENAATLAEDDAREAELTVRERKFDFARFSNKFMTQPCVDTWTAFLTYYKDLSASQLKRAHRYFYRLAFKNELYVYLFRVDILLLFHRLIRGPEGLDRDIAGSKDWEMLVRQVFRKCVKWLERENSESVGAWKEFAVVEMLFSKAPNAVFYLQNGYERVVKKAVPRPPMELEVKPSVHGMEARVGVAAGVCIDANKSDQLRWVKAELNRVAEERESWESEALARYEQQIHRLPESQASPTGEQGPEHSLRDQNAKHKPPTAFLTTDSDAQNLALFRDKHLRLLLSTIGCQRLGLPEDINASWVVPPELSSADLRSALAAVQHAEVEPPTFEDGTKTAGDMIRSKAASRRVASSRHQTAREPDDTGVIDNDGEASSDSGDAMFPPNLRERRRKRGTDSDEESGDEDELPKKRRRLRNKAELTDADRAAKRAERRKKEKEKNAKIKSALYVTEKDDRSDEEEDRDFFRREEETRAKMAGIIRKTLLTEMVERGSDQRSQKRARGYDLPFDELQSGSDGEESDVEDSDEIGRGEAEDVTPATSSDGQQHYEGETTQPLKGVAVNTVSDGGGIWKGDDDEDNTVNFVAKAPSRARRNIRAGFVVDDDSDEDI